MKKLMVLALLVTMFVCACAKEPEKKAYEYTPRYNYQYNPYKNKSNNNSSNKSNKNNDGYDYSLQYLYDAYNSYDDGYDDVINESVDEDRYYSDTDYADAVDEACDEYGIDW